MQTIEISFGRLHAVPRDQGPRDRAASCVFVFQTLDALLRDASKLSCRRRANNLDHAALFMSESGAEVPLLQCVAETRYFIC